MRTKEQSKYARLKAKIKAMITDGGLPADTRLPSQHELTRTEKMSYATITRALNDLVREQWIYRVQGRGTFVAPAPGRHQARSNRPLIKHLVSVRLEDEKFSVAERNRSAAIFNGAVAAQRQFDCDVETVYIDPRILESTADVLKAVQYRENTGMFCYNYSGFEKTVACFKERNIPYLVHGPMDCLERDINCIVVDVKTGARLLTEELIRAGRTPVAVALNRSSWTEPKLEGCCQALAAAGIPLADDLVLAMEQTEDGTYRLFSDFLERRRARPPAAVLAATDTIAFGVIRAIRARGLRTPEDIAVTGYDDIPEAAEFDPPLTTVRYDRGAIGRESVRLLLKLIQDSDFQPIAKILRPEIVFRQTFARA